MARKPKEAEEEHSNEAPEGAFDILEFDENLDDIADPVNLPDGTYRATVMEVVPTANQAGTGYYYNQRLIIPITEYPPEYDQENAPDGTTLYYRMVSVPQPGNRRAIARVKRYMNALGLSLATNRIDISEWVGRDVSLTIRNEKQRNGDVYPEIKNVARADA